MIEVPGDILEGGGQILRTSVSLAALLKTEVTIRNVRAKRTPPGFRPQHVTGVSTVAAISKADVEGLQVGSTTLRFSPRERAGGDHRFDVGTAGSITLVLQALMPVSAFTDKPVRITIVGGTDVRWSPSVDYLRLVTLPNLALTGYNATLTVEQRGHYPKGGGRVTFTATPVKHLNPLTLEGRGVVKRVQGISHCVNLPRHVAERQAQAAERVLKPALGDVAIDVEAGAGPGPGSGITLAAVPDSGTVLGSDSLGERGKPAEKVGEEAAFKLLEEVNSGMALDRHMGDAVVPYLAVAKGKSTVTVSRITLHTVTNIRVIELIAGVRFSSDETLDKPGRISVEGLGLTI